MEPNAPIHPHLQRSLCASYLATDQLPRLLVGRLLHAPLAPPRAVEPFSVVSAETRLSRPAGYPPKTTRIGPHYGHFHQVPLLTGRRPQPILRDERRSDLFSADVSTDRGLDEPRPATREHILVLMRHARKLVLREAKHTRAMT